MAKGDQFTEDTTVSSTELAKILGVTVRRIQQMSQDGTIQAASRGRFPLFDSVQRYITFLGKNQKTVSDLEQEKMKNEAAIKKAKATVAMLEANELVGKMHRSEDVSAFMDDLLYTVRNIFLALPGRLAVDTSIATTPAETADIIRKEVHMAMREIAGYKYDPKAYAERVRERRKWESEGSPDD